MRIVFALALALATALTATQTASAGPLRKLYARMHTKHTQTQQQFSSSQASSYQMTANGSSQFATASASSYQSASTSMHTGYADQLTAIINRYRQQFGRAPLTTDPTLANYATQWSQKMTYSGFRHSTGWLQFGGLEVIAKGQRSPEEVVASWMNSPGHRNALMAPNVTRFGGGRVSDFWTGVTGR